MEQVQATATVTEVMGNAFILRANGEKIALQQGDALLPGTIIMTESGSQVVAQGPNFKLELEEDSLTEIPSQPLTESADNAPAILGTGSDEVAALQAAILDGLDPTQAFEAAAAGAPAAGAAAVPDGTAGGGSGNGGFVTVARTGDAQLGEAGFDTAVAPLVFDEIPEIPLDNLLADDVPVVPEIVDPLPTASITIDTIAGDDIINAEEAKDDVTITGTVGGDVKAGDTVTVIVNGKEYTTTVNPDGTSWNVNVPGSELVLDSNVNATVTTSDAAGNTASADADRPYGVVTEINASITIDTIAGDDIINADESQRDVTITGTVGDDVKAGDTVTVTVNGKEYITTVNPDGTSWNVNVPGSELVLDSNVNATVTTSDAAGNTAIADADRPYGVDTTPPVASIEIDVIAGDDIINAAEAEGDVTLNGTVGGDVKAGDTVIVTVNGKEYITTVNPDGTSWNVNVPGSELILDSNVNATVTTSDAAGNTATADADRPYGVDTEINASIAIDVIAGDDIINAAEAEDDVTITGIVGDDVKAGDTVTVTVNGKEYITTVNPDGTSWNVNVPGSELILDSNVNATVTTSDAAGNTATADADRPYGVDTEAPNAVNVTADGYEDLIGPTISSGPAKPIDIKLSASDAGGEVEFLVINSLPDNGKLYFGSVEITQAMVDAGYQVPADVEGNAVLNFVPKDDWSGDASFEYQAVDSAGNTSADATVNIKVLPVTDIPEVTVTIEQSEAGVGTINLGTLGDISGNTGEIKGPGFTITGKTPSFAGDVDSPISVYPSGKTSEVSGFGVAGKPITADGDKSEIAPGQALTIAFDNPVTDFTAQLSWVKISEYAKYTIYAEDGTTVIGTGIIKGIDDKTNPSFTIKAMGGELIGSVVFSAAVKGELYDGTPIPDNGSDFLIHEITFPTSTYALNISATPTDIDGSESIISITVEAPEGALLSHGTQGVTADGITSWDLPLVNDGSYQVRIAADGTVTITGVTVTVTGNVPPTVTVIAEAQDSSGTITATPESVEVDSVFVPVTAEPVEVKLTIESNGSVSEGKNIEFTIELDAGADTDLKDTVLNFTLGGKPGDIGTADSDDVGTPTATINGTGVFVVVNGDGSYSITIPAGTTDGIIISVPTLKDNVLEQTEDLILNATLTGEADDGGKLVAVGGGIIENSGTGIIIDTNPNLIKATTVGMEDAAGDTAVIITLPETDGSFNYVITSLPVNGVLYVGGIAAVNGQEFSSNLVVTFEPTPDWSGKTGFEYQAKPVNGDPVINMQPMVIDIKPVTDAPTLEVTGLGAPVADHTQTINRSNINLEGKNFTVSTTIDGVDKGVVTTVAADKFGNVDGFGVAATINAANKSINAQETVKIEFKQSVTDLTVKFSGLNAGEKASYTVYDEGGLAIGSGTIDGQAGKISPAFNISALYPGKEISAVEFTSEDNKSNFYINEITYKEPNTETYALNIKTETTDADGSEIIKNILVKVAAGVVLSHGTLIEADANGYAIWALSLNSNQGYTVTPSGNNGYEIEGVTATVPTGVTPEVEVITIAKDGSAVSNSTSSNDNISNPENDAPNYILGTDKPDTINGSDGDDIIFGSQGGDVINGGAGNDIIYGGTGNDTLKGGDGDDIIYGGDGNDIIYGGAGNDTIFGGAGADKIYGGLGDDIIDLGVNDGAIDIVVWTKEEAESGQTQNDKVTSFELGIDKIDISGFLSNDEKDDLGSYLTATGVGGDTLVTVKSGTGAELNITLEGVVYDADTTLSKILTDDLMGLLP